MRWEELTAPDFARAVKDTGVCVLSVGSLEKHFDHLPLGTDLLNAHDICCLAAEAEPAIVFPLYYLGQVHEARCFPGTVAIPPALTLEVLWAVCDEIARNGLHKIIMYNGHGGNTHMLNYACQATLSRRKGYAVYVPASGVWPGLTRQDRQERWDALLETPVHGHACECETSISLANHPHLVKMDAIAGRTANPLGRLDHIPPGRISGRWYSNHPDHYAGNAAAATREKGLKLRQLAVDSLAEYISAVKNDSVALDLLSEFHDRCDEVGK